MLRRRFHQRRPYRPSQAKGCTLSSVHGEHFRARAARRCDETGIGGHSRLACAHTLPDVRSAGFVAAPVPRSSLPESIFPTYRQAEKIDFRPASPVAIFAIMIALPMTSAGRRSPLKPIGGRLARVIGASSKALSARRKVHDIAASARLEEVRPSLHERPPLFERAAPPVSPLCGVADDMGERGFRHLAGEMRFVAIQSRKADRKPCTVTLPRPMRRRTFFIAMAESGRSAPRPEKTNSPVRAFAASASTASARADSGTRCSRAAFMRAGAIVPPTPGSYQ